MARLNTQPPTSLTTYHDIHTAGMASITQTFHQISVLDFCACSAHLEALNILRIVEKRTIYMQPYDKLIRAETNDSRASVLVNGSSAASGTWNMLSIALGEVSAG